MARSKHLKVRSTSQRPRPQRPLYAMRAQPRPPTPALSDADEDMASDDSEQRGMSLGDESSDIEILEGPPASWRHDANRSCQRRARADSEEDDIEFVDAPPPRSRAGSPRPQPPSMASVSAVAQAAASPPPASSAPPTMGSIMALAARSSESAASRPPSMQSILEAARDQISAPPQAEAFVRAAPALICARDASPEPVGAPRVVFPRSESPAAPVRYNGQDVQEILASLGLALPDPGDAALVHSDLHLGIDDLRASIQTRYNALVEEIEELASMYRANRRAIANSEVILDELMQGS
ncbi:hypothetical protein BJ138DRAFT_1118551 [Hygrophoropsis aurantiaca]|uniref:Uncharacterized protein n=1 Tax=Hygrophoropsis aurantiaca TaxID=72124 RepID=A0ACB7ZX47_9AGAM|nr:hypothetical protein BJ138DRAFT_1118551 [Hygrophoropsis aurantiaca]